MPRPEPDGPLRVLLVDDEPLVRRGLRALLADEPDVRVVGEAGDGREGEAAVRALRPDLVFLDVQMPEQDGFALLGALAPAERPAVVFVTAYDVHAVRAFEVYAVDYLVKPFDDARLRTALGRARARLRPPGASPAPPPAPRAPSSLPLDDAALAALTAAVARVLRPDAAAAPAAVPGPRLERLLVRERDRTVVVPVDAVDWFEADGNYVRLHTHSATTRAALRGTPMVRETLAALAAGLDPRRFARVHRSAVVRLAAVRALEPLAHGEQSVVLADGTRLTLGRTWRADFEARLQGQRVSTEPEASLATTRRERRPSPDPHP